MKISVITPSYNQGNFIAQTIESVITQTGDFSLEYFIIDGGSKDNSLAIIKQYAARDSRITWVSEPDHGQTEALNKGLKMATGDIIAWINSDDYYLPGTFQLIQERFKTTQAKWLYGQCIIVNDQGSEIKTSITAYKNFWLKKYAYNKLLILNFISQPATFFKRELLTEIGYFNDAEHLAMDYEYWCRIGKKYAPTVLLRPLAAFRSYQTNKSSQKFVEQFRREYAISKNFTSNKLILGLHYLHGNLIILAYKLLSYL